MSKILIFGTTGTARCNPEKRAVGKGNPLSVLDYVHDYGYNKGMNFEWDENKREANIAKHGLDLMTGACLFDGRRVYSYPSPRGEENRYVTVGLLAEELVAVVWTARETGIRLISLRRARDAEKRIYRAQFGG